MRAVSGAASLGQALQGDQHGLENCDPLPDLRRVTLGKPMGFLDRTARVLPQAKQGSDLADVKTERTRTAYEAQRVDVAFIVAVGFALRKQADGLIVTRARFAKTGASNGFFQCHI